MLVQKPLTQLSRADKESKAPYKLALLLWGGVDKDHGTEYHLRALLLPFNFYYLQVPRLEFSLSL